MNCDICYQPDESITKKCCLNICFPCDWRVTGQCYVCDREYLNDIVFCDICQKEITLFNTFFCNRGMVKPNHNVLFCRECGIVDERYLVSFCSDECDMEDYHYYQLSTFFEIQNDNPNLSIKKCLEQLEDQV